jgi:hypothetical protein
VSFRKMLKSKISPSIALSPLMPTPEPASTSRRFAVKSAMLVTLTWWTALEGTCSITWMSLTPEASSSP